MKISELVTTRLGLRQPAGASGHAAAGAGTPRPSRDDAAGPSRIGQEGAATPPQRRRAAAASNPPSTLRARYEAALASHGLSTEQLQLAAAARPGRMMFVPAASTAGTDVAGVLKLAIDEAGLQRVWRLPLVRGNEHDGAAEGCWFAKGPGHRALHTPNLLALADEYAQAEPADRPTFGARLSELAEQTPLYVRRSPAESTGLLMGRPPVADPIDMPSSTWGNFERFMLGSAGPADGDTGTRTLYVDHNTIDRQIVIFRPSPTDIERAETAGPTVAPKMLSGPVLATIDGVRSIEAMAPAGLEPGVKGASLRTAFGLRLPPADADRVVHITTQDGAVHRLTMNDQGLSLSLVNPRSQRGTPPPEAAMTPMPPDTAHPGTPRIDAYSYRGGDPGVTATPNGFPESRLVLDTGEALMPGPFMRDGSGLAGTVRSALLSALRMTSFEPVLGENRTAAVRAVNTAIVAVTKASVVAGMAAAVNALTREDGLIPGGSVGVSAFGAGRANTGQVALAITGMVLAHEGLGVALRAVDRMTPDSWKHAQALWSRVALHGVLPAFEEAAHLLINYGVLRAVGLPRGGVATDVAALALQSTVAGGIQYAASQLGQPHNHPGTSMLLAGVRFANESLMRALGNALSASSGDAAQAWRELPLEQFGEALLARVMTRGPDRLLAPMVQIASNAAGVSGPNASAFEHQVDAANRRNNVIAGLRAASNDAMVPIELATLRLLPLPTLERDVADALTAGRQAVSNLWVDTLQALGHEPDAAPHPRARIEELT